MPDSPDLDELRAEISVEYMRGLPDAYAGGPTARAATLSRLFQRIDVYAEAFAASHPAPTMATRRSPDPKPTARKGSKPE